MILEILLILISFAVSLVLFQICVILYRQAQTNKFFKLKSPNLPLIDNPSILGGHAATFVHRKDNCLMVHKCHQKFGRTLGAYHASRPSIGTTDLDLIKFMVIDEPDAHVNRMKPNIPFEELETHTLMFAEDEQWRRLRQASAPSFT